MKLPEIDITVENGQWPDEAVLRGLAEAAITTTVEIAGLEWPEGAELSLLFTDDTRMCGINKQWRDIDKTTNVLSFPGADIEIGQQSDLMIGDLVFALETVQCEAEVQNKEFEHHLTHLIVHGFLHLFGYDHQSEDQAEVMEQLETSVLLRMGINDPYDNSC